MSEKTQETISHSKGCCSPASVNNVIYIIALVLDLILLECLRPDSSFSTDSIRVVRMSTFTGQLVAYLHQKSRANLFFFLLCGLKTETANGTTQNKSISCISCTYFLTC